MTTYWLKDISFIIFTLSAFALFAVGWLHWDADKIKSNRSLVMKFIGFMGLSFSMLLRIFAESYPLISLVAYAVTFISLSTLVYGVYLEPILPKVFSQMAGQSENKQLNSAALPIVLMLIPVVNALLAGAAAVLYWQRYSKGLIREYKLLVVGMGLFSIAQLLYGMEYFGHTDIILLQTLFATVSITWISQMAFQLASAIAFLLWFWQFVKFRVRPEMFITLVCITVAISTISAMAYSFILFSGAEQDVLRQMHDSIETVDFAVANLQDNALTAASLLAKTTDVVSGFSTGDLQALYKSAQLYAKEIAGIDAILFTDKSAQVLVNTANLSEVGNSLSNDDLIIYALEEGKDRVSVVTMPGVLADEVVIKAVYPVFADSGDIVGVVQTRIVLDDAFVDDLKRQTGMEVTVYIEDKRSATTLLFPGELTRRENTIDTNEAVTAAVLEQGQVFTGRVDIANEAFHGGYSPLRDSNGATVGMIFVGRPGRELLERIDRSVDVTFAISILVSLLSMVPAYQLSKRIEGGGV